MFESIIKSLCLFLSIFLYFVYFVKLLYPRFFSSIWGGLGIFELLQQADDPDPKPCWLSVLFHSKEHGKLTSSVDLYAASVHFSMTTLATVGYGDITPQVKTRKVFFKKYNFLQYRLFWKIRNSPSEYHLFELKLKPLKLLLKTIKLYWNELVLQKMLFRRICSLVFQFLFSEFSVFHLFGFKLELCIFFRIVLSISPVFSSCFAGAAFGRILSVVFAEQSLV